ncbi:MAG: AbrB/MazE/SpoVT family DNA-binding domain-containing protein [Nanoarchaeota archaeon]|nr:AbrB/MazE/SpoVT family DNA-binding domain-containing protein [Nanoarchaeota archaeon]MBU4116171.1 AbrB/MazE/SpoVT family DNA-binding domain-containing protein [Nanoarchaeota archaeon]
MVSITKISSKGQVVIPREIRERLKVKEGNLFLVIDQDNSICLKKIEIPKIKTWQAATKPFKKAAQKSKFTKDDLLRLIQEIRLNKK